jgi:predicted flap endonuclease-1-like 5' DNA nuclease
MVRKHEFLIGLMAVSLVLMAFSYPAQIDQQSSGIPWWVWAIFILLLAILIGWLLGLGSKEKEESAASEEPHAVRVSAPAADPAPSIEEKVEPPPPDDLKLVEGIGPKISGLLQAAGITTFAQLADAEVSQLRQIILDAGITIADPTTWPEQAKLAAAGKWDELAVLQDNLKGGRVV